MGHCLRPPLLTIMILPTLMVLHNRLPQAHKLTIYLDAWLCCSSDTTKTFDGKIQIDENYAKTYQVWPFLKIADLKNKVLFYWFDPFEGDG